MVVTHTGDQCDYMVVFMLVFRLYFKAPLYTVDSLTKNILDAANIKGETIKATSWDVDSQFPLT